MQEETRSVLELFVEKAHLLRDYSFSRLLSENALNIKMSLGEEGVQVEHNIPERETIDALLLTLRMFIQDNEPISLRNVHGLLADASLSEEWRKWFAHSRDTLTTYLNAPTPLNINGRLCTSRDMLNMFLYGDHAHTTDRTARVRLGEWRTTGWMFEYCRYFFAETLVSVINVILRIAYVTELELAGQVIQKFPAPSASS